MRLPDVRPLDRDRLAALPREEALRCAALALDGIQREAPEAQVLAAATLFAGNRAALLVINTGSASLYLDPSGGTGSTADAGTIPIPAGGYLSMVPPPIGPVTVYSAAATTCTVIEAR